MEVASASGRLASTTGSKISGRTASIWWRGEDKRDEKDEKMSVESKVICLRLAVISVGFLADSFAVSPYRTLALAH